MRSAARLYAFLKVLAAEGSVCPRNIDIARTLKLGEHQLNKALSYLREENRIAVERAGNRRIVRLLGTGLATADPRPADVITVRPPVRDILTAAAEAFDTTAKDIASRSRFNPHVRARQAVCLTAWKRGWTSTQIARSLDKRDHSTVIYHRDTARRLATIDPDFAARLAALDARTPQPFERTL